MKNSKTNYSRSAASLALALVVPLLLSLAGCKAKVENSASTNDAALTSALQQRVASDRAIATQPIQVSAVDGVATLNGSVDTDANRSAASADAAQVAGVRTVVNNLVVNNLPVPPVSAAVNTAPPAPVPVVPVKKPTATIALPQRPNPSAPIERGTAARGPSNDSTPTQAPAVAQVQQPAPPPPAPVVRRMTVPAGTTLPVRITQTLDSETTQTGDSFTGAVASDIVIDGLVVLPQGTSVTGRVDEAKDAAHFKGSSVLTISLTAINRRGEHIAVNTDSFTKEGEGRGKNTAEKVGGGAAVGAIIGGIFGGGKGAAIGAGAGAGVGAGAQGVTRGQQVQIASETLVRFRLEDAITVRVGGPDSRENPSRELQHPMDE
jgi:hypothetical protein